MATLASPPSTSTCSPCSRLAAQGLRVGPRHLRLPAGLGARLRAASRSASLGPTPTRGSVGVRAETQYLTKAEEAKELVEQGYTVLDVRDPTQYVRAHVSGSVHIPFFIVNEDQDLNTAILRQAHRNFSGFLYGLAFTKPNPTFYEDIAKKFPQKDAKILVVCQEGLRSNSVVDELEDLGYTNLATLSRGLNRIPPGVLPKEGPRELMNAGKGGFVAIQTQFSVVLATILIGCIIFLEYFPDQATEILKSLPTPPAP